MLKSDVSSIKNFNFLIQFDNSFQYICYFLNIREKIIYLKSRNLKILYQNVSQSFRILNFKNSIKDIKNDFITLLQKNYKALISEKINYEIRIKEKKNELLKKLQDLSYIYNVSMEDNYISFNLKESSLLPSVFNILKDFPIEGFNEIQPGLENLFLKFAYEES